MPHHDDDGMLGNTLRSMVNDRDSRPARVFDGVVAATILLAATLSAVETLPGLSPQVESALVRANQVLLCAFTAEYLLRLSAARSPRAYALSLYGVIDLLTILPFLLTLGTDSAAVRTIRLLRIFVVLKLGRYSAAAHRFAAALWHAREEFVLFLAAAAILLYVSAAGIYYFEHDAQPEAFPSIPHSLWWAVATLTTVGYGDVYPVTTGGRAFTFVILMLGLGVVAVPAGILASALTRSREVGRRKEDAERAE